MQSKKGKRLKRRKEGLKQAWKRAFSGKISVILLQRSARGQTSDWLFTFGEILISWQHRSAQSDYKIYSLFLPLEDSFLAKCMVTAWYHSHLISNNNLTVSSSYSLSICLPHSPSNNKKSDRTCGSMTIQELRFWICVSQNISISLSLVLH